MTTDPVVQSHADLRISDLTVEYSSGGYAVRPIDGLNQHFQSGELVILLGASGCGKSTLLSVLAAILQPKSGGVRLGDPEVVHSYYVRMRQVAYCLSFELKPSE